MHFPRLLRRPLAILATGTILAAAPVAVTFHAGTGFGLGVEKAFAKNGSDDSGGDDRGGSGKSGGGKSDDKGGSGKSGGGKSGGGKSDDRGGSGKGGSGKSDDRGGDDDAGDDHGGRGRGGDDPAGDDNGGRGRGSDDAGRGGASAGGSGAGASGAVRSAAPGGGLQVVKVERSATGLEVIYSNGVKEEIEGGRYELKNPAGRTVIERAATRRDVARIDANVAASRGMGGEGAAALPGGARASRVEAAGGAVEVVYDTGWKEEIEGGRYELKDPNNNTVVERPATGADRTRLLALGGS